MDAILSVLVSVPLNLGLVAADMLNDAVNDAFCGHEQT